MSAQLEARLVDLKQLAGIGGYARLWTVLDRALSGNCQALSSCKRLRLI